MRSESERASCRGREGKRVTCPITPKFLAILLLVFGHYLELLLPLLLLSRILTFSIVIVVVLVGVGVAALLLLLYCC